MPLFAVMPAVSWGCTKTVYTRLCSYWHFYFQRFRLPTSAMLCAWRTCWKICCILLMSSRCTSKLKTTLSWKDWRKRWMLYISEMQKSAIVTQTIDWQKCWLWSWRVTAVHSVVSRIERSMEIHCVKPLRNSPRSLFHIWKKKKR